MTTVRCTFNLCEFFKPCEESEWEDYGICQKDEITLDDSVGLIICGCPDAEWKEGANDESINFK